MNIYKNTFSEIGLDPDNHKLLFGLSTEFELENGNEIRENKLYKVDKILSLYLRIWICKHVIGISLNFDKLRNIKIQEISVSFWHQKKNRNSFKFVFGRAGYRKDAEQIYKKIKKERKSK